MTSFWEVASGRLILKDQFGQDRSRVLELSIDESGKEVIFLERCDKWCSVTLSKRGAIETPQEAIKWIEENVDD